MKKELVILFVLLQAIVCSSIFAQSKRGKVWVHGGGISYKTTFETSGITNAYLDTFYSPYFTKGNSNICDTNGNLILCSDGYNIYDSIANFIDGGDTLVPKDHYIAKQGWSLYSQTSIFLPMDSNKYYFVTPAFSDLRFADCNANNHCYFDLLFYNIIDMNANGGAGKVVKRMQPLMENAELRKTQMMACRHSNGKDWWLLKQAGDSNRIHKFLFTQDSVYNMDYQQFDAPVWGGWDITGQSCFSHDGKKYASNSHGSSTGKIFLADFDRCYGILSNPKEIIMPQGSQYNPNAPNDMERLCKGLAYSPNGQYLYAIGQFNIWQFDFADSSWFHVAGMDTTFNKFQEYDASYYGADGKLYVGNFGGGSKQMSRIDAPDVKGAGCSFCPRCLRLDSVYNYGGAGTPPCMPNYSLGKDSCYPLGVSHYNDKSNLLDVYPNPASTVLYIKSDSKEKRELYNSVGQLLIVTKENEIDVRNFTKGIYYIKVANTVKKIVIE
jgi:hypothetical protein